MNAAHSSLTFAFGAILSGCAELEPPTGGANPPLVPVEVVADVTLDTVLPSDLLWRPDGDLLLLDGYGGSILRFAPDGTARGAWGTPGGLGRPVRLSAAQDGGVWAVVPGLDDDPGVLLHLNADGLVDNTHAPQAPDGEPIHPVDVVDLGASLLVAERSGGLLWLDAETGRVTREVTEDSDHAELRRIVDLALISDGSMLAVDTLTPRVFRVRADGTPAGGFGRMGLAAGRLARPTAAAPMPGGPVLIADAVLGAVQAFTADGSLIGLLAAKGAALHFGHPVAVRADEANLVAVLDARPAVLHILRLAGPLPAAPPPSLIRTTLAAPDASPAGGKEGDACIQCHDGLVNDSRQVWDPASGHHPRNMIPAQPLPAFFPVNEDGQMVCTTCHSPHGVVDPVDASAATSSSPPTLRHMSPGSPFLRLDREADALCLACHADEPHAEGGSTALTEGATGHVTGKDLVAALKRRAQTGTGQADPTTASCLSCHAMHGASGEHITRDPGDGTTCLGCHPSAGETASNHPLGRVPGRDLLASRRGEHVVLSTTGGVGCLSCHDLAADTGGGMLRSLESGKAVCLDCHSERKDLQGSAHAHLVKGGQPTCVACHDVHGGNREARFLSSASVTDGDPTGCLGCHGPGERATPRKARPGQVGHPVDGRAFGEDKTLTCLSCHDAHAADKPTAADCATCHEEQKVAAARGGHGDATCIDCHPAHSSAPAYTKAGTNPSAERCLACHAIDAPDEAAPKTEHWEHPVPAFKPDGTRWTPLAGLTLYAPDGTPAAPGSNGDLTCQSCHVVHGPETSGEDHLRRASSWKAACSSCHGDDALVLYRYYHNPERRADLRGATP